MLMLIVLLTMICLSFIVYNFKRYGITKDRYTPTLIKCDIPVIHRIIHSQILPKPQIKLFQMYQLADENDKKSSKSILFDAEPHNLNDPNTFDFVLTTKFSNINEKSVYLPAWSIIMAETGSYTPNMLLDRPKFDKTKFCAFMYSNCSPKERNEFFDILNSKKPVDALGSCKHNVKTEPHRSDANWIDLAVDSYKPYKFVIAFENTINLDGYITEKFILPLLAGCIPIYYGAKQVKDQFVSDCFINVADFESFEECVEYVLKVDSNDILYNKYINSPIITHQSLYNYAGWYYGNPDFYDKLYKVFPEIKRIPYKPIKNNHRMNSENVIKVINLKESKDRWEKITKQFSDLQPHLKYERFPAVNGSKYGILYKKYINTNALGRNFTYGEIGIYLSTMEIFNTLVKDEKNDYYVVLEDDIILPEEKINLQKIVYKAPKNWDIIFLGYNSIYGCNPSIKYEKMTPGCMPGNFAFIVRKKAAQYFLNFVFPIDFPVDENYRVNSFNLNLYLYHPQLIKVNYDSPSTVHNTGTI